MQLVVAINEYSRTTGFDYKNIGIVNNAKVLNNFIAFSDSLQTQITSLQEHEIMYMYEE